MHAQVHKDAFLLLLASFSNLCSSSCVNTKESVFALFVCRDSHGPEFQVCL